MPTYEYQCADCGKEFEYQQRMSDDPKTECEACSGKLNRLISRTAFHLKGGGWYKDLYSSPKPEAAATSGADSAGDKGASSTPSAESTTSDTGSKAATTTESSSKSKGADSTSKPTDSKSKDASSTSGGTSSSSGGSGSSGGTGGAK